ncbi:Clock-controlled 6 [Hyphodiscus hymeniophilus]|uniref:Clock-controlled 6 n=1 Tax=Hyphodiscus hymeniophilus TaxID=353542 RepID=A0A9P7AXH3_9HELO|nr:Clock-controlled 6 [Hyphodiscus hymeniophilus]
MKYAFAALAFAAGALAGGNGTVVYTTDVVTAYTTFCPEATTITHGTWTYTATASETVTVTNCPCTISKPVVVPSTVLYSSCPPSAAATSAGVETQAPYPTPTTTYTNPLVAVYSTGAAQPSGTVSPSVPFTGAASANKAGALLGAIAGVVAMVL